MCQCFHLPGILFGDYDEQLKLQKNISMVVLRSLGYGKKSVENKILDEADHLVEAFKVSRSMADPGFPPSASPPLATLAFNNEQCRHMNLPPKVRENCYHYRIS